MLDAAQAGASLYIMDGSGLHFIMSGAGLRAGFDGYLSEMLGTLRRYRLQEQSVAAVREFGTENPFSGKTRTCLSELSCTK